MTNNTASHVIHFSDDMSIETSGPYRIIRKSDGLYVVGNGELTPVDTPEEGAALIRDIKAIDDRHKAKVSPTRH